VSTVNVTNGFFYLFQGHFSFNSVKRVFFVSGPSLFRQIRSHDERRIRLVRVHPDSASLDSRVQTLAHRQRGRLQQRVQPQVERQRHQPQVQSYQVNNTNSFSYDLKQVVFM
jgi:hypothetical protein